MNRWSNVVSDTDSVLHTTTNRQRLKRRGAVHLIPWIFVVLLITITCGCSSQAIRSDSPLNPEVSGAVEPNNEKHNTGWAVNIDNDVLTTEGKDHDYTGGFAVTLSGQRATEYLVSVDSLLNGVDALLRFDRLYDQNNHFDRHSFQFGLTLFTPRDISVPDRIPNDRPYGSLLFVANTEQTVIPGDDVSYQTTLAVGLMGLDAAEDVQEWIHDGVGGKKPNGWDNQISAGGEPTVKYAASRQQILFDQRGSTGHELKTTLEGNIGFSTDLNMGFSWRWGRIHTPWWSFNPHQAEYINIGLPVNGGATEGNREFFLWAGVNAKYRLYNALLQGQFRDSAVTFNYSELEHVIGEAWLGVTRGFGDGLSASLFIRGRTNEIDIPDSRNPVWGGIIVSRAF